jgi:hypothetical protein
VLPDSDGDYEVIEIRDGIGNLITTRRGECLHRKVVPVESGGKVVATLCLVCDRHFYTEG